MEAIPNVSSQSDPDIRFTRIGTEGEPSIGTEVGLPQRIWRELEETNLSGKVNLNKKFNFQTNESKLKFGGAYTFKEEIMRFKTSVLLTMVLWM